MKETPFPVRSVAQSLQSAAADSLKTLTASKQDLMQAGMFITVIWPTKSSSLVLTIPLWCYAPLYYSLTHQSFDQRIELK